MLTVQEIANAVGGSIVGEPVDERPITSVVVDSRHVAPGALFVALKGQKHDGHDFVFDAFVRGARAALVERIPNGSPTPMATRPLPMIRVRDSLAALQDLATYWRQRLDLIVVAVTGSVGKTTTKEVVAELLQHRFKVLRTEGNLNTEIGLPLTLLQATPRHQVAVVEMGMYAQGEIRSLARVARPDIGVVTNVGPTHLERLGSIERIAQAKAELVEELPERGLAVLNHDDERVRAMSTQTRAEVRFYGLDPLSDFWADSVQSRGLQGIEFDLCRGEKWVHVRMPLLGLHSVHAALAAAAVGDHLGMSLEEIAEGLHEVSTSLRLIVVAGINGSTIVDDSYNASPASTLAALNLLAELEGRRVAVLGDMLELGSYAEEGHQRVGRRAADVADVLVAVGSLGALVGREALAAGKSEDSVFLASTNREAIQHLKRILQPGDCVLVKGSRGMRMEEIVEAIRCPTP
ncbi:MAG: UDP-N-acetylmuramoyl-tripeptide--D-alanyl-D-alanine ligase [Sphingomonadaceae bacterium]